MPMRYLNLTLIGTSHIAKQSVNEVRTAITDETDIVAVELDPRRLHALMHNVKNKLSLSDITRVGLTGFLFAAIGAWAQKKLGKVVNISPGADMLAAVKEAKRKNKQVFLIDQDIAVTLNRLSMTITWKEKLRFPYDIIKAVLFRKSEMERLGLKDLDLSKVPPKDLIKKLTDELRQKYPNVHKVLVAERNTIMAKKISALMQQYPDKKIVAVIGAGHEEEMLDLIRNHKETRISYEFSIGPM